MLAGMSDDTPAKPTNYSERPPGVCFFPHGRIVAQLACEGLGGALRLVFVVLRRLSLLRSHGWRIIARTNEIVGNDSRPLSFGGVVLAQKTGEGACVATAPDALG
jgi:hypothetical protein